MLAKSMTFMARKRLLLLLVGITAGALALVCSNLQPTMYHFGNQMLDAAYMTRNTKGDDVTCSTKREQEERHRTLQQACSSMGFPPHANLSNAQLASLKNVLVIEDLKLLYCFVPKVGCSSWKSLLLNMTGHDPSSIFVNGRWIHAHDKATALFPSLSHFDIDEAREILTKFNSFIFARNPFSRILSAYRNKMIFDNNEAFREGFLSWLRVVHPEEAIAYDPKSRNISFTRFIQFYMSPTEKNEHWREIQSICQPCHVHYDFIGLFDTIAKDSRTLLGALNAGPTVKLPFKQQQTNSSTDVAMQEYYSQLPRDLLESLLKDRGIREDMAMFGFEVPRVISRLTNV